MAFPGSSAGKEPACNAGVLSSIPEAGRYPGGHVLLPWRASKYCRSTQDITFKKGNIWKRAEKTKTSMYL